MSFSIRPLGDRPDGTLLTNKATVVFDSEASITTNEVSNTLGVCTAAGLATTFVTAEPAGSVELAARVSNTAGAQIAAGLPVAFYANGTLIGTAATTQALDLGASEVVTVTWTSETPGDHTITIVANDDGTGSSPCPCAARRAPSSRPSRSWMCPWWDPGT